MFFTKALSLIVASLAITSQAFPAPADDAAAQVAATHTGDATYYTPGPGACGHNNKPTDLVAAAAAPIFDKDHICGKKAKVSHAGKSVTVTIVDRCPGCGNSGIDLSPSAFEKLAPLSVGRLSGVKWTIQ
ncbi:barwin-like endoglucanase [Marasmius fiardii PR-910]|nr:barwin-like endoglucanase [Marasmius fiardii PR-910]